MIEAVRHFDPSTGNIPGTFRVGDGIYNSNSSDSFNNMSCAIWAHQDYFSSQKRTLAGRLWDFHNGWAWYIKGGTMRFFATGNPVDDPSEIASCNISPLDEWSFLAMTYDRFAGSQNVKFYQGTTPDNLTLVGTADRTGGFSELGVYAYAVGNCSFGGEFASNTNDPGALNGWNGSLKRFGHWYSAVSFENLKRFMACSVYPDAANSKLFLDITGENPEPQLVFAGTFENVFPNAVWTLAGTTVEYGPNLGCGFVPATYPFYKNYLYRIRIAAGSGGSDPGGGSGGGGLAGENPICSQLPV